jgi:hypothetical protein
MDRLPVEGPAEAGHDVRRLPVEGPAEAGHDVRREPSERGAILVIVAIAILVLVALLTFVVDFGILWIARGQAQNAADAGALAGAAARVYDDFEMPPADDGKATASAVHGAERNPVWGAGAVARVSWACPTDSGGQCARVEVYRNGEFGSAPLPVLFGRVLNLTGQGVRATATAEVIAANATTCLRSFAIPDRFAEYSIPPNTQFDAGVDEYIAPSSDDSGSGYTLIDDYGAELLLREGSGAELAAGRFRLVDLAGGGEGAGDAARAIRACTTDVHRIGDDLGDRLQPGLTDGIADAVRDLIALDPDAEWDDVEKRIVNSCIDGHSTCGRYDTAGDVVADPDAVVSPRVLALPIFNPETHALDNGVLEVVNLLGFFITGQEGAGGKDIRGRIVTRPGQLRADAPLVAPASGFLVVVRLIR